MSHISQLFETCVELWCQSIIGVVLKSSDSPETITRRNRPGLFTSQSTEFCDVSIIDSKGTEAFGKDLAVKLGIGLGTRYVPDVNDDLDFVSAQHFDKIGKRACGMSDGKKAIGHLMSMFWPSAGSPGFGCGKGASRVLLLLGLTSFRR